MVVRTQFTSAAADKAQHGVMELLLINHPLDCPVCDKGGECPLQNQAMSNGRSETRFTDIKRTFPKPINLSSQVLLDRERCVLCARCTRFANQIAGDPFIELLERGALQQVGIAPGEAFDSYFSGNTVQICPVGALTGTAYRFRARPFDLVSSPSVCEHCASGCSQRTDHRRGVVLRRLAGDDPEVNEEWNCDKGRWAFTYTGVGDRIATPLVRDHDGSLRPASWSEAIATAVAGLTAGRTGVLVGGRATTEDAYAYAKFARMVLRTNDIDMRSRPHSAEEAQFLAAHVAGRRTVSYADLEAAPVVLLVGLEPEEESPIVFLRLRKAVRKRGLQVVTIAPLASRGSVKLAARVIPTAPGTEAEALDSLDDALLTQPGAIMLVGERLATSPGALSAAARVAQRSGARLAWVPRRAGERGGLDAGCLPNLLPGGRPVADSAAREQLTAAWHIDAIAAEAGRDTDAILTAAADGHLDALLIGGVEPADMSDPHAALAAIEAAGFVVSLEQRESAVTALADVVFPVAPVAEKAGSFTNWEGRIRRSTQRSPPTRSPICGCCRPWPTNSAPTSASAPPIRPVPSCSPSASGTVTGPPPRRCHPRPRRPWTAAKRCWPVGGCCWTTVVYKTVSRIWRGRHGRRWCGCRRPPRRVSVLARANRSACPAGAARSPCRWRSPRCRTGWCGCRCAPPAARCTNSWR